MALGSKNGYYYKNTVNFDGTDKPLPFSVMLTLTFNGGVRFEHY
jgi:hypothetical protein